MTTRVNQHAQRYQRAMKRITLEHETIAVARALKELGLVKYPGSLADQGRVDALVAHKLGRRA